MSDARPPGCVCLEGDYEEIEGIANPPPPCAAFEARPERPYRQFCKTCDHYKDCHGEPQT